ncbi:hypothetical protein J2Z66_001894 [Paenibacillus eucommiae]|uniref:Uncharacterized protein n=1 Tax=Paenibacillus eucommiae TaxID=1355755 RepID=A0ABS4ITU7_9BACL|nr:hypothetical protein [Paenibacillus eucommiae]
MPEDMERSRHTYRGNTIPSHIMVAGVPASIKNQLGVSGN